MVAAPRAEAPPAPRLPVAGSTVWSAAPPPPDAQLAEPAGRFARTEQPGAATRRHPVVTALRAQAPPAPRPTVAGRLNATTGATSW